jgi:hypothetical protein
MVVLHSATSKTTFTRSHVFAQWSYDTTLLFKVAGTMEQMMN